MRPPARTLTCVVCGASLDVEPRQRLRPWTPGQLALAERLWELGAGRKFVARALGDTSPGAIYEQLWKRRGAP